MSCEEALIRAYNQRDDVAFDAALRSLLAQPVASVFPAHQCGLSLEHNENRNYYETVSVWAAGLEKCKSGLKWISPEQRQKAEQTNEVWVMHWYPDTPVGFYCLAACDLEELLKAAQECSEGD